MASIDSNTNFHSDTGFSLRRFSVAEYEPSLARDRAKAEIYATAGISHYWIVNLKDRELEVFRNPNQGRYEHRQVMTPSQHVDLTSLCFSESSIPVSDLFLQETAANS